MFTTIKLRSCQRCGGDLALREDADGQYWTCLTCSTTYYPAQRPGLALRLAHALRE